MANIPGSKAYDIRGLYKEQLDESAAWKIGHATAQFLRSLLRGYERGQANAQSICPTLCWFD